MRRFNLSETPLLLFLFSKLITLFVVPRLQSGSLQLLFGRRAVAKGVFDAMLCCLSQGKRRLLGMA